MVDFSNLTSIWVSGEFSQFSSRWRQCLEKSSLLGSRKYPVFLLVPKVSDFGVH